VVVSPPGKVLVYGPDDEVEDITDSDDGKLWLRKAGYTVDNLRK
jgi:hypothetical protein